MILKNIFVFSKPGIYEWPLLISSVLLLAIWPLPGTIALRHFLLSIGFLSALPVIWSSRFRIRSLRNWPIWVFFSFFCWLVFHLFFLSSSYPEQLDELKGLWFRAFLGSVMGLGLGLYIGNIDEMGKGSSPLVRERFSRDLLVMGFGGTICIFFVRYLYEVYKTNQWLHFDFYMTPYAGKPPIVIFGAIFFTLILINFKQLLITNRNFWRIIFLLPLAFLVFFAEYFANTKNGMVMLLVPTTFFIFSFVFSRAWTIKKFIVTLFFILPIALGGGYVIKKHVEANAAWPMLLEDIRMGVDIDSYSSWKDVDLYPYPKNQKGVTVNNSTYERSAWAVASFRLIKEYPLGYGLVHHSFGALAIKEWPDFHKPIGRIRGASHSGLLDFTLGMGVPGLLLILVPFGAAFIRSLSEKSFWNQFVTWIFPVLLLAYLITEVSTGHFVEILFFIISFCLGIVSFSKCTR